MNTITLTNFLIEKCKTVNGGFTKDTLQLFGVDWPPESGWKRLIIGKEILKADYMRALEASLR